MTSMNNHIENRLWAAADQLWANSPLKPSEYSAPVLGLIFLKYADYKFMLCRNHFMEVEKSWN
jgi:type I restriction enzyme M protein